jgi:hypothetical protein
MSGRYVGLKLIACSLIALFIAAGCDKESANPAGSGDGMWIESTVSGRIAVLVDAVDPWFKVVPANTSQLQFGAAGRAANGTIYSASIIFPLGAVTGTYTVTPIRPDIGSTMAANTVYVEMGANDGAKNIAQSGSVTLTVTGTVAATKHTIDYADLPSLSDETPAVAGKLGAHLTN